METIPTYLSGVIKILPKVYKDNRGYLFESYSKRKLEELGINTEFENVYQFKIKESVKIELPEQTSIIRAQSGSATLIIKKIDSSETTEEILEDKIHYEVYIPKGHSIEIRPLTSEVSLELFTDLPL